MIKLTGFNGYKFSISKVNSVESKLTSAVEKLLVKANEEVLPLLKILFTPAQLKYVCVAGGYTRNILIDKPIGDIDIFTSLGAPLEAGGRHYLGTAVLQCKHPSSYEYSGNPYVNMVLHGEFEGSPFDVIYLKVDTNAPIALATAATFDSVLSSGALVYNITTDSLDFVCTKTFLDCLDIKQEIYCTTLGSPSRYTKLHRLYGIHEEHPGISLRYRTQKAATKYGYVRSPYTMIRVPSYGGHLFGTIITITKEGRTYEQTCIKVPIGLREEGVYSNIQLNHNPYQVRISSGTLSSASSWEEVYPRLPTRDLGSLTTYATGTTRVQGLF